MPWEEYSFAKDIFRAVGFLLFWSLIWAPSSEFVSSRVPSLQISTAHAQPFREARDLIFCLKGPLDSLLVWASSEGSGETARMHRLAWTFAARIGDKYQIRLTRSIWCKIYYTLPSLLTIISPATPLWCWILFKVSSTSAWNSAEMGQSKGRTKVMTWATSWENLSLGMTR